MRTSKQLYQHYIITLSFSYKYPLWGWRDTSRQTLKRRHKLYNIQKKRKRIIVHSNVLAYKLSVLWYVCLWGRFPCLCPTTFTMPNDYPHTTYKGSVILTCPTWEPLSIQLNIIYLKLLTSIVLYTTHQEIPPDRWVVQKELKWKRLPSALMRVFKYTNTILCT